MKLYHHLLLAVTLTSLCLIATSMPALSQSLPEWLNGEWEGRGYQIPDLEWDMQLYKDAGDKLGIIIYPGLKCKGYWKLVRKTSEQIILQEIITENNVFCASPMWVYLTRLNNDEVLAEFAFDWEPEKISAKGILRRRPRA